MSVHVLKGAGRLGVIGGLGPDATARLYRFVVDGCLAAGMEHYPDIVIHSVPVALPVEDAFVRGYANACDRAAVIEQLIQSVRLLAGVGAELVLLACNTLHAVIREATAALGPDAPPVVDMPGLVAQRLTGLDRVLVLCTASTRQLDIYGPLVDPHISLEYPPHHDQLLVEAAIMRATRTSPAQLVADLAQVVRGAQRRADAVLLGCTDLDTMTMEELDGLPVVGSLRTLGEAAITWFTQSTAPCLTGVGRRS